MTTPAHALIPRVHRAQSPLFLLLAALLLLNTSSARADNPAPSENLLIQAAKASTWADGPANILQLEGPVSIELDQSRLTADSAVVWLSPVPGSVLQEQRAQIALVGHATLAQGEGITRSGESLYVTAIVRGTIRLTADQRLIQNLSTSDLYRQASALRVSDTGAVPISPESWRNPQPWTSPPLISPTSRPAPASQPSTMAPVFFPIEQGQAIKTADDLIAIVLTGGVQLFQRRPNGELLELQADRVVVFTTLRKLSDLRNAKFKSIEQAVTGAYLEGDVRIVFTPSGVKKFAEQRLAGERVFYDFTADRAVLTQAVLHTYNPKTLQPIIMRAQTLRQLSAGEYTAERAVLTTSSFATPSFDIGLRKVYIHQIDTGDPRLGTYTEFVGDGAKLELYKTPVFYLPHASGTIGERGSVFRNIEVTNSSKYGPSVITQWGLFETLGKIPPRNGDITYQFDFFGKRGPAAGIDGHYQGANFNETTQEPWSYSGQFSGFFVNDTGVDKLDRLRPNVDPPTPDRGRIFMEHQHFLPDGWQVQLSLGYSSDPTFLEEWYEDEFYTRRPQETSLYVKKQQDSEAMTFLLSKQLNTFVTTADLQQEQAEVERLPQIGYRRLGDSLADDTLTTFSENTASALDFRRSRASLRQQGFNPSQSPGLPSFGTTGEPTNLVYRGDFRQELDAPFMLGHFKMLPYVLGRYTVYSDSPLQAGSKNRLYTGVGLRINTAFARTIDSVESQLFDLHRLRHVIEPEVHLFAGAQNVNRTKLLLYDEQVDEVTDITAAQLALRQRWQTQRGGPGRWRSVDVLSLNIEANLFSHKPNDPLLNPRQFRGLFFDSIPESSIPRNSLNADATWHISDSTQLISDVEYNLDRHTLATASVGFAVQRGDRLAYFIGQRYIGPLNSNITTIAVNYQLTSKYTFAASQLFDLGQNHNVATQLTVLRHFDRFYAALTLRYDEIGNTSGFLVNVVPEGFGNAGSGSAGGHGVFQR